LSKVSISVAAAGERASSRLPRNFALSVALGYCQRIGMIDNEQGEPRALLTNDVISPHLSLGVRVSRMGASNHGHHHHWHEHHHHWHEHHHWHHGHDGHNNRYDNRYDRFHEHHHRHEHHGYDGHHNRYPTKHPAT
jgi:hypothetical protein